MMRRALRAAAAALILVSASVGPALAQPPEWMPLAAVRPGMQGTALTVVRGTTVESFDAEVLAIVPGAGPSGDLILIRASGPLIRRTGGIAAGMSGSPVYVNRRLVGAVGFGWAFADHSLGLVTPIESMLRAIPGPRAERRRLSAPVWAGGRRIDQIAVSPTLGDAAGAEAAVPHLAAMVPLARPLLVSGMGARAAQLLAAELGPLGATPVEGAAGGSTNVSPPLVPGSAIGVQLIRGDLNAVSIGTLTYRRGKTILAFGHPLLNRGRTGYLLTAAEIHGVVPSTSFPFKIGSAGAPVGAVIEDRRAGIAARLGSLPPLVGVRVVVTDSDRGRTTTLGTHIVRDPQLGPVLALVSALEAVDRALDRVGEGTARVRLTLRARGLDGPVVRENVFYHARDIGSAALLELPEALRLLFANEFVRTGPIDVTVSVEAKQNRLTASVIEAEATQPRVGRGEEVSVRITLRPYQGAPIMRLVTVAVPQDFPAGPATLLVRAGGRLVPEQGLPALLAAEPVDASTSSVAAQLTAFSDRDQNTDLVVELVPSAARFPDATGGPVRTVRVRAATEWVVRGRIQLPITVDAR